MADRKGRKAAASNSKAAGTGELTEPVPFDGMSGTGAMLPVPSDQPPPADEVKLRAREPQAGTAPQTGIQSIFSENSVGFETTVIRAAPPEDAEIVPPPPPQGVGPHFEIGDAGVITLAPPEALDRQGNNVRRLRSLHPTLCDLSRELARCLSIGNIPHRHLYDRAEGYRQIIDHQLDTIDFSLLYVEGVRLANAAAAAAAEEKRDELPPLDEPVVNGSIRCSSCTAPSCWRQSKA